MFDVKHPFSGLQGEINGYTYMIMQQYEEEQKKKEQDAREKSNR